LRTAAGSPTLIVLAAGMGSRYGGLKQIAPVGQAGEAIVDYSVYDSVRAGFGKVVFVIRKEIEQLFRESVGSRLEQYVEVDYAFQELDSLPPGFPVPPGRIRPWGTLQATLVGAELTYGPFAVINADDFYGAESYRTLARRLRDDSTHCAMVGFRLRNTLSDFGPVSRGVCRVDDDGVLLNVVEMTEIVRDGTGAQTVEAAGHEISLSGDEIVSMNMWGFTPAIVEQLRSSFHKFLEVYGSDLKAESYLPEAIDRMVSRGQTRVKVLLTDDAWCGITYPQDYEHVLQSIRGLTREGKYPEKLWP